MTRIQVTVLWFLFVAVILGWTITTYIGEPDIAFRREILIRHGLLMIILSMPSGVLLLFALGTLADWLGLPIIGVADAVLTSITCGMAGYLQWFVLSPWLWRRWKGRHAQL